MIFNKRSLALRREDKEYRSLRDYTDEELISYLENNMVTDLTMLIGLLSEILRRMNEKTPLLPKKCKVEWGGTARCMTSDGKNVNIAEELNRLERELINE